MTVDQSMTRVAPDRGEASSRFGWVSTQDINEAQFGEAGGGEPGDCAETMPGSLMAVPAFPAWPRVYPGL